MTLRTEEPDASSTDTLPLTYEQRRKHRQVARLASGEEIGVALPRGTLVRGGDVLLDERGAAVRVVAAPETVSVVRAPGPLALARAAYHLGNRHVALQIAADELVYRHDHVLDGMVRALGLDVRSDARPFEAEAGPYRQGAPAAANHDHDHDAAGHHHAHR